MAKPEQKERAIYQLLYNVQIKTTHHIHAIILIIQLITQNYSSQYLLTTLKFNLKNHEVFRFHEVFILITPQQLHLFVYYTDIIRFI